VRARIQSKGLSNGTSVIIQRGGRRETKMWSESERGAVQKPERGDRFGPSDQSMKSPKEKRLGRGLDRL